MNDEIDGLEIDNILNVIEESEAKSLNHHYDTSNTLPNELKKIKDLIVENKNIWSSLEKEESKKINYLYWEWYNNHLFYHITNPSYQKLEDLFFYYGILDQSIFPFFTLNKISKIIHLWKDRNTKNQTNYIKNDKTNTLTRDIPTRDLHLIYLLNWYHHIYDEKIEPSINILGLTFEKAEKHFSRKNQKKSNFYSSLIEDSKLEDKNKRKKEKLIFEMQNILNAMNIIATNIFSYFIDPNTINNPTAVLLTPQLVEETINSIIEVDFSLFYRDIAFHPNSKSTDILKKKIKPLFILLPMQGAKVLFWQEMEEHHRKTRARFFFPTLFIGDFKKSLILELGRYRWELQKKLAGNMCFASTSDGGLTGAFFNYFSTFQKNSRLSQETKEHLYNIKIKYRNDLQRIFSYFYFMWIEKESKGIIKLDKEARYIFFKFIPFSKKFREKLSKFQNMQQLINKHNNLAIGNHKKVSNRHQSLIKNHHLKQANQAFEETINYYTL